MLKGWGIVLTKNEKQTLYKFLALYLGSAFIFLSFIAWFFWQMEYHLQRELIYSKMRQNAGEISAKITHAHMRKKALDFSNLKAEKGFMLGLYDKAGKPLISEIKHPVDFKEKMYQKEDHLGVVDSSVLGHKGVSYVVVEERMFVQTIEAFTKKVIGVFIGLFLLLSLIGYWLAKLFIKPIYNERQKLDTFIKDSTHELNTPITALLMSTSSANLTSEKNIERIRFSAKRISELYEDLTYLFLREPEVPEKMLALDRVLQEQIAYLQPFADKKSLQIVTDISTFEFLIDKESAIRLVNNLISNAIKYSEIGGKIEVILANHQLIVKDHGIGIEEEKLKDIFERFYRATSTSGGFGIGLDMVRTIAQKYAIMIEVKSELTKGTTFILNFPH
jgi:two-component system OmpR family sensor kinase